MRAVLAGLVVAIGCGDAPSSDDQAKPTAVIARLDLPALDESARVLVLANAKPAALLWIAPNGNITIGKTGPTWDGDITPTSRETVEIGALRRTVLHAIADAGGPRAEAARLGFLALDRDIALAGRRASSRIATRDLVMGGNSDPMLAAPGRLASTEAVELAKVDRLAPLVIATPSAPATAIARAMQHTGGVLAVDHLGKLAALTVAFERERDRSVAGTGSWLEVFTDATGLHLVVQPAGTVVIVPWAGAAIDRAALRIAYRRLDLQTAPIDVVVRDDTTAQTLVDILAALAAAEIRPAAVVAGPSTAEERKTQLAAARAG
ncbi:MAG: hypothetical protein H0V17_26230, partial [Deltaproteobacteria bacterium]|nr:hypothetical protein [Deltaproteobacteria bacterium]